MLITFQSKAASNVLMLDQHAAAVLRAAGRDHDTESLKRGIFTVEQIPGAIAALERAIADEQPHREDDDPDEPPVPAMAQTVNLRQRAFPLLDMLRRAHEQGVPVLWEAGSAW